jgi:hypothetical protein
MTIGGGADVFRSPALTAALVPPVILFEPADHFTVISSAIDTGQRTLPGLI